MAASTTNVHRDATRVTPMFVVVWLGAACEWATVWQRARRRMAARMDRTFGWCIYYSIFVSFLLFIQVRSAFVRGSIWAKLPSIGRRNQTTFVSLASSHCRWQHIGQNVEILTTNRRTAHRSRTGAPIIDIDASIYSCIYKSDGKRR